MPPTRETIHPRKHECPDGSNELVLSVKSVRVNNTMRANQCAMAVHENTNNKSEYAFVGSLFSLRQASLVAKSWSGNVSDIVKPATQNPKAIEAYAIKPVVRSPILGNCEKK